MAGYRAEERMRKRATAAAGLLALVVAACGCSAASSASTVGTTAPTASRPAGTVAACERYAYSVRGNQQAITDIKSGPAAGPCSGLSDAQRQAITWNVDVPDAPIPVPTGGS